VATQPAREALAVETVRGRFISSAMPGLRHVFALPRKVADHLGLRMVQHGPRTDKGTDDGLVWLVAAPEHYEYRAVVADDRPWQPPPEAPMAHVYLARSLYPFPEALEDLAEREVEIEEEEWKPAARLFQRTGRGHRSPH
jgi:hypothetical protein